MLELYKSDPRKSASGVAKILAVRRAHSREAYQAIVEIIAPAYLRHQDAAQVQQAGTARLVYFARGRAQRSRTRVR